MQYILNRLQERSTWLGIGAALAAFGVKMSPDQWQAAAMIGTMAAGAVAAAVPTKKD